MPELFRRRCAASCVLLCLACCPVGAVAQSAVEARPFVYGLVRGPLGRPMPSVQVLAARGFRGNDVVARSRTDDSGVFVLGPVPVGERYRVLARQPGYTVSSAEVALHEDHPAARVELRVYEARVVRGRVVDPDGAPVQGASVLATKDHGGFAGGLLPPECKTDAQGRFELEGVPIGDCVVRAWLPGLALRQHWLNTAQDAEVELQLLRGPGLRIDVAVEGVPAEVLAETQVFVYPAGALPRDRAADTWR